MSPSDIHSDDATARAVVERETREFLFRFNYKSELDSFGASWKLYKDLPLEAFASVRPKKDRMWLPGMKQDDVNETVIEAVAAVFLEHCSGYLDAQDRSVSRNVGKVVEQVGASPTLVDQLMEHLANRLPELVP